MNAKIVSQVIVPDGTDHVRQMTAFRLMGKWFVAETATETPGDSTRVLHSAGYDSLNQAVRAAFAWHGLEITVAS